MKVKESNERIVTCKINVAMKTTREQNKENESPNVTRGKRIATENDLDKLMKDMQDGEWKKVKKKKKRKEEQETGKEIGRATTTLKEKMDAQDDQQSEAGTTYESEKDEVEQGNVSMAQEMHNVKDVSSSISNIINKPEKSVEKKIYWNHEGKLHHISENDASRMDIKLGERYDRDHGGPFKVQIRINREKALKNRGKNAQKFYIGW